MSGGTPPVATGRAEGPLWEHIRHGLEPTEDLVADVAATDAVTLGSDGVCDARRSLRSQVLGAGPLEPLLADDAVTDVLVNGTDGVWADRGGGLEATSCHIGDEAQVRRLAVRLAGLAGRRLDDASPYVDGLLPGGVRLHAILPPLVERGPHISLRVPRRTVPDLGQLHQWGSFDRQTLEVLQAVVQRRLAFVVSGGTGSGKTTLLGALLGQVPPDERIVLVEDVRELHLQHPHVVRLQGRSPNVEGRGEVTLTTLVRQSLRMRPDRLVVGEVRGPEVRALLSALNTGHEGGCGTLHANTSADVPTRFEALGALAGMAPSAVRAQLTSVLDVVLHVRRVGSRRVLEEIALMVAEDGPLHVVPALTRAPDGGMRPGPACRALADRLQAPAVPAGHHPGPAVEGGRAG